MVSQVPHCPTVAPLCAVTHWQCTTAIPACHPVSAATQCPTVPPLCAVTHWQCPPLSAVPHCPTVAPMCPPLTATTTVQPTFACSPTHMLGCPATHTCPPTHMAGCPNTATCPPHQTVAVGQAPVGPTGVQGCTQSPAQCGNTAWHGCNIGHTGWQGCNTGHTHVMATSCPPATVCPQATTLCPPAQGGTVHATLWTQLCPTSFLGCPATHTCPPTTMPGCPNTATCGQANHLGAAPAQVGPTGVQGCTQSPAQCGNTAWHGCPVYGPTGVQGCTQSPVQCGNTAWHGCPPLLGPTAWQGCAPTHAPGCTCLPMTVGPVMTVAGSC